MNAFIATGSAIARIAIGVTMISAGTAKVFSGKQRRVLENTIAAIGLVGNEKSAFTLGVAEMALGTWLISGLHPRGASAVAALLLTLFSLVLIVLLRRGFSGGCACFMNSPDEIRKAHVVGNAILVTMAILTAVRPGENRLLATWLGISEAKVWALSGLSAFLTVCISALMGQMLHVASAGTRYPESTS